MTWFIKSELIKYYCNNDDSTISYLKIIRTKHQVKSNINHSSFFYDTNTVCNTTVLISYTFFFILDKGYSQLDCFFEVLQFFPLFSQYHSIYCDLLLICQRFLVVTININNVHIYQLKHVLMPLFFFKKRIIFIIHEWINRIAILV